MTRVFIDTRLCHGWQEAAVIAAALNLDLVSLVANGCPNMKAVEGIELVISAIGSASHLTVVDIPPQSVRAVESVRELACSNDVIVTDSCLFAIEFIRKAGAAVNNRGYEYTEPEIFGQIDRFYRRQELKRSGLNPYHAMRFKTADRERLQDTLGRILAEACGMTQQEVRSAWKDYEQLRVQDPKKNSLLMPELRSSTKVYVDGDSCPALSQVIESCGAVGVPVVYVSNRRVNSPIATARKRDPELMAKIRRFPMITSETVPVRPNSADNFIWQHAAAHDIVLTGDLELIVRCLNKGAAAIDYRGRVYAIPEGSRIRLKGVRRMREEQRFSWEHVDRVAFREALERVLAGYEPEMSAENTADACKVLAFELAKEKGRVTTRELRERVGRSKQLCLRALKDMTAMGMLEWHGSSSHDPTQFYSLAG